MYAFRSLAALAIVSCSTVVNSEYLSQCTDISVNYAFTGPFLWAGCNDSNGVSEFNSFDLDNCLQNNDGVLAVRPSLLSFILQALFL